MDGPVSVVYGEGNMVADSPKPPRSLGESFQRVVELTRRVGELSQSATVLVACAVLDAEFERALKVIMRPLNSEMRSRLFDGYGPLSSFSSKVDLAYALNITTDNVHANLVIIKSIRNKFAHTAEVLTLQSDSIQALYRKLKKPIDPKKNNELDIFIECVDEVVSFLQEYLKSKGVVEDLSKRAHATLAEL
jgi:DNA-binding MltR family transcriptional regulator